MAGGAFQTSREIFDNPIWQDVTKFRIFFFIVGNAVFSEEGVRKGDIIIKRGQYLRSYRNLQTDLEYFENRKVKQYSVSVISRKIDSLVKEERLKIESTELGTLFTVVNYDMYQGFEHYKKQEPGTVLEQGWNSVGTVLEQSGNNNKKVNKENKVNKEINTTTPPAKIIWDFWDKNGFGYNNINAKEKLAMYLDEGFETEVIIKAMSTALDYNKVSFAYVSKVLNNWAQRDLKTISLVNAAEAERQKELDQKADKADKPRQAYGKKIIRTEYIPEYMDETIEPVKQEVIEDAAGKGSIMEKLKAFRGE